MIVLAQDQVLLRLLPFDVVMPGTLQHNTDVTNELVRRCHRGVVGCVCRVEPHFLFLSTLSLSLSLSLSLGAMDEAREEENRLLRWLLLPPFEMLLAKNKGIKKKKKQVDVSRDIFLNQGSISNMIG
ncbi:hypothetical protein I7I48_04945 [Histoplasma ohiense]|nr:hypothetical protein I7I48_04945 [Histoplasma ohiense (nom. inval.)]